MTTKIKIAVLSSAIAVSGALIMMSVLISAQKNETVSISDNACIDMAFIIREYDGCLAVFRGEAEKPYYILDTKIEYLNEYDRELVRRGIAVYSETELRRLIEDLTS